MNQDEIHPTDFDVGLLIPNLIKIYSVFGDEIWRWKTKPPHYAVNAVILCTLHKECIKANTLSMELCYQKY
jgi:hypothetical protein